MATVGRILLFLLELACYLALLVLVASCLALVGLIRTGACNDVGLDLIECDTELYQQIGEFALTWFILTIFTGVPLLLALGGIGFGLRRLYLRREARSHGRIESFSTFCAKRVGIAVAIVVAVGVFIGVTS